MLRRQELLKRILGDFTIKTIELLCQSVIGSNFYNNKGVIPWSLANAALSLSYLKFHGLNESFLPKMFAS